MSSRDSLAQWIMTIFTVVAAGLLFGTLIVARDTLLATQVMAKETTRIGEAQVRAYLTIKDMTLGFNDSYTSPKIQMTLANTGQSPAREVEVVLRLSFFPKVEEPLTDVPDLPERRVRWWFDDVTGGEDVVCTPSVLSDVRLDRTKLGQHLERLSGLHLSVAVFAKDVFEKEVTTFGHFALGWSDGDDRRKMKNVNDFTRVYPASLMIEELRPYRLGHEKDGQG